MKQHVLTASDVIKARERFFEKIERREREFIKEFCKQHPNEIMAPMLAKLCFWAAGANVLMKDFR